MRWSAARPIQLAGTVSQTTIAVSAANQPRVKHRLFRIWIKRSREGNVTTRLPRGRCEAAARQRLEAAFGLRQRFQIFRVKMMTGIACVIHDDLRSHRRISTVWVSLPARSNCNRNTTRRAEAAFKVVRKRERQAIDENDQVGSLITDAYATVAIAHRRASAAYTGDEEMKKLGTAAVHLLTIATSYMAAQADVAQK
jgi:hypothetical protein